MAAEYDVFVSHARADGDRPQQIAIRRFGARGGQLVPSTSRPVRCCAPRCCASTPEHHVLLVTMHHVVSDGWSMGVLVRELVSFYEAFS